MPTTQTTYTPINPSLGWITASLAGGTQFNLSGSTTQPQSLTLVKQAALVRSTTTQAQTLSLIRGIALVRSISQGQTLSIRRAVSLTRSIAQAQALSVRQAVQRTLAMTQAQSLSIVAQRVFLRTVTATQAQSVALTTAVRRTYTLTVSAIQAQVLSLVAVVTGQPPPVPVVIPSSVPAAGVATGNYLDWPTLVVTPVGDAPPASSCFGVAVFGLNAFTAGGPTGVPPPGHTQAVAGPQLIINPTPPTYSYFGVAVFGLDAFTAGGPAGVPPPGHAQEVSV